MDNSAEGTAEEQQLADELQKQQGHPVGKRITVNGEAVIMQVGSRQVDVFLEVDKLRPEPKGFRAIHKEVMEIIFSAVSQINEMPNRIIPLTRKELIEQFHANPKAVKKLEGWGYIRKWVIKAVPKEDPRAVNGQHITIFYLTPQGRAYVREHLDASYGLPKQGEGGGSDSVTNGVTESIQ